MGGECTSIVKGVQARPEDLGGHELAYILIALAVFVYALYPSAILKFSTGKIDILSYLLVFHIVASIVRVTMALYYNGNVLATKTPVKIKLMDHRVINTQTVGIGIVNAIFDILGFGSFFFALYYGSAVQAAVFYELWASAFLLLTMFLRRNQPGQFDHHHGVINTAIFFVLGVLGVILVVSSHGQARDAAQVVSQDVSSRFVLVAAIASPIFMAISFFIGTKNARIISLRLREEFPARPQDDEDILEKRIDIVAGIYHGVLLRVLGVVLLVGATAALYSLHSWQPQLHVISGWAAAGILLCALISAAGGTLADISNNVSQTSNLNQFWSFTPFLAVIFLNAFGFTSDTSKELYFGAILILSANYILLSKSEYSKSFIASIFFLCVVYFLILFVPPVQVTKGFQHVTVPLGIFGIFAALFLDRIMKNHEDSTQSFKEASGSGAASAAGLYSHYIFILWILGLGSVFAMVLFRPEGRIEVEFVSAFVAVAVIYICLLPVEYMMYSRADSNVDSAQTKNIVLSLVISALFITCLFILYLFALLQKHS